jgi:hypothetical protein
MERRCPPAAIPKRPAYAGPLFKKSGCAGVGFAARDGGAPSEKRIDRDEVPFIKYLAIMKKRFFSLFGILLVLLCATELPAAAPKVDFGDMKSSTLTAGGWGALGNKNYEAAIVFATKCIDTFKVTALDQQKAAAAGKTDKGTWALNDVGVCYYIRAQAYEGLGKNAEAIADYKYLAENLALTQTPGDFGSTWTPATAAKERAIILAATTNQINTISKVDSSSIIVKTPAAISTYRITAKTQIDFKGKPARISDLKTGMRVEVTAATDPQVADRISADDPPRK